MKTLSIKSEQDGLTLVEVVVVIVIVFLLVVFFMPSLAGNKQKHGRITCINNLKQVGLSFRIYAGDHRDRYPMNISTNDETVVNETTPVYQYLKQIANELGTPKVVICPDDKKRKAASDFVNFGNSNVSYFIGLYANEGLPQTMLSGDRNITNGFAPKRGILELMTNRPAGFTDEIHLKQGNVALGDGSVQQVSSARLRSEIIANTGFATNTILLP